MKSETYCLGDVCTFIDYRGKTPPKTTSGIPLVTAKIVKNGIIQEPQEFIAESYYDEWMRRGIPKKGSVVFTTEAPLGEVARIRTDNKLAFAQRIIVLEPKTKQLSADYLFYALQDRVLKSRIEARSTGTTVIGIKAAELKKVEIDLPSLGEQEKIAAILRLLDEKIELNNKINENLEQQAQMLYKQCFPYSVDGVLPDGWRIGTVGEIIEIHDSKRIPLSGAERAKMEKKIYPYYGAASLMDFVDDYIFDGKYLLLGEDGTVVDDAGYPILQYVWGQFWVNNHAHILTGKLGFNVESLYMLFKQTLVKSIVTGAVQPKISQANLRSIQIVVPPEKLLIEYNCRVEPLFSLIRTNEDANKSLASLRDTLLPKLISGEIDVSTL